MKLQSTIKNYSSKGQKILREAKNKKKEYDILNQKILLLRLEDVKNRNNSNKKEIVDLELQLIRLKQEVDEKSYKAAQLIGIFK